MEVNLMVRRKNETYFLAIKDSETVLTVKRMICGITGQVTTDIKLHKYPYPYEELLSPTTLLAAGYINSESPVEDPATLALTYKTADGSFEPVEIHPFSAPSPLDRVLQDDANLPGALAGLQDEEMPAHVEMLSPDETSSIPTSSEETSSMPNTASSSSGFESEPWH